MDIAERKGMRMEPERSKRRERSIAFPAISTGVYGFPKEPAAKIAVAEAGAFAGQVKSIFFVCFDEETVAIYERLLSVVPKG